MYFILTFHIAAMTQKNYEERGTERLLLIYFLQVGYMYKADG